MFSCLLILLPPYKQRQPFKLIKPKKSFSPTKSGDQSSFISSDFTSKYMIVDVLSTNSKDENTPPSVVIPLDPSGIGQGKLVFVIQESFIKE